MAKNGRLSQLLSAAVALGLVFRRLTNHHTGESSAMPAHSDLRVEASPPVPDTPPRARGASGLKGKYQLLSKAVTHFIDDDCATMAAALAYYTTFSIAPLLLIVISIVGIVFGREAVEHEIQSQIQGLIGQGAASQVGAMVQNAAQHSSTGILGAILGVIALIAGATGAFSQLQSSLNRVWHVTPDPNAGGIKNFIGHRVLSLGMILAIAFLLLVSLAISAALAAFGTFAAGFLPQGLSKELLTVLSLLASLIVVTALFAAMFKVLPDAKIAWRDVWTGAAITAVLFTIGKFLIGVYLGHSGTASSYGAAGSFVLIVLWIYYSSMIFLFGAELTEAWSEAYSGSVQPKAGAVKVETEEKLKPPHAA